MPNLTPQQSNFLLYTSPNGKVKVDVFFQEETVWLTQKLMAELFGTSVPNITMHLKNLYKEQEINENSVIKEFLTTATDGKQYKTKYYNLDAIISVGYRVNSQKATQFRIWATRTLREFIIKGFVLDDERLKQGHHFGKDYFDELLEKIREIRASERRFYQKITDIYATSIDYDLDEKITKDFFATVQNKLHFAITGQTAAEIIKSRVNNKKPNMGLATWKNAPKGKIRKTDVVIAKNYLNVKELDQLNRIVTMYLDYAEMKAHTKKIMYMKDWVKKLDAFLQFNEKDILQNLGLVSHQVAVSLAEKEFKKFSVNQDKTYISDFDRAVKKYLKKHKNAKHSTN